MNVEYPPSSSMRLVIGDEYVTWTIFSRSSHPEPVSGALVWLPSAIQSSPLGRHAPFPVASLANEEPVQVKL